MTQFATPYINTAGTSAIPNLNIQWQGTTSGATYSSASSVLQT